MSGIANVHIFENGNVMVFDEFGQQIPEYQSSYTTPHDERHSVLVDAPKTALFRSSVWAKSSSLVSREEFAVLLDREPDWHKVRSES